MTGVPPAGLPLRAPVQHPGGVARDEDDDAPWTRQLAVGLGALVVVALVIGGLVGAIAVGAARLTGIDTSTPAASAPPSLYIPSGRPTASPEAVQGPQGGSASATPPGSGTTKTPAKAEKPAMRRPITLRAFPKQVASGQRINLAGTYRGRGGDTLQVQRLDGGWQDFDATASVRGGAFRTYIYSGRTGLNLFRVLDTSTGRASAPVRVRIG